MLTEIGKKNPFKWIVRNNRAIEFVYPRCLLVCWDLKFWIWSRKCAVWFQFQESLMLRSVIYGKHTNTHIATHCMFYQAREKLYLHSIRQILESNQLLDLLFPFFRCIDWLLWFFEFHKFFVRILDLCFFAALLSHYYRMNVLKIHKHSCWFDLPICCHSHQKGFVRNSWNLELNVKATYPNFVGIGHHLEFYLYAQEKTESVDRCFILYWKRSFCVKKKTLISCSEQ